MKWITDRTHSDVMLGNEKGQYTYQDLNRVELAVKELSALAKALDVQFDPVVKLDWQMLDTFSPESWPVESQMRRYLENVQVLCSAIIGAAELPVTMDNLTWEGANQIERALAQTEEQIQKILTIFRYSGELYAAEEAET